MVSVFNCRNVLVGQRREQNASFRLTEEAQEGSIEYEFPVDLEVSAADQAIGYISMYDNVPESLLQEAEIFWLEKCVLSFERMICMSLR